jgi:hypothetical protein
MSRWFLPALAGTILEMSRWFLPALAGTILEMSRWFLPALAGKVRAERATTAMTATEKAGSPIGQAASDVGRL